VSDAEAILRWYAVLTVVTVAALPAVAWLGAPLGPARYGLTRPVSLAVVTAMVWWPAAVTPLPFSRVTLGAALLVVAAGGWLLWFRAGLPGLDPRAIAAFELLWLASFLGYAWFRSYQPDIINTEKPMEIALLTSISRSSAVPAPDPWLAGSSINYYYFGYQSFATIIKLSSVPASIGFNLALASLFASCATVAAAGGMAIARALDRRRGVAFGAALLAVVLLLLSANLETARRLLDDVSATVDASWWQGVGWQASRIIYDDGVHQPGDHRETINEFPAFSFVLGDLHPHVLTYPLLGSVIVLAIGIALAKRPPDRSRLLALGALIGLLFASNSWDAPAGLLLVLGAIALMHRHAWRAVARDATFVVSGAILAVLPFLLHFDAPVGVDDGGIADWLAAIPVVGTLAQTFGIVSWRPSSAREIVIVHGVWIAIFVIFAAVILTRDDAFTDAVRRRRHLLLAAGLILLGIAVAWAPAVVLLGVPLATAVWIAVTSRERAVQAVALLFAMGFTLTLLPEFIYIRDVFADRMNTVFKLYFQAWLVFSIAAAAALVIALPRAPRSLRPAAGVVAGVCVVLTLAYTPLSAMDWTEQFADRRGLDGRAYIEMTAPGDAAAMDWVAAHAQAGDSIVEAPGCSYVNADGVPMDRVSAFTGVPTVVGWVGHEGQWRRGQRSDIYAELDSQALHANAILDGSANASETAARFVILGPQEVVGTTACPYAVNRGASAADALVAGGWVPAFEALGTTVFARPEDPTVADAR
jgi:YYY domain-containing protein